MFFNFKYPNKKKSQKDTENTPTIPLTERTEAQIQESIQSSLRRTRREIADIVDSNDFDKFATFTFDPKKHPEASDYQYAKKKIVQWLNKQQARHGSFRYIVVPERQNNGNLHFHALLGGFTGKYHATNERGRGDRVRQCYKIDSWEKNNGFADMEDIGNKEATGKYIAKYIAKDLTFPLTGLGLEPTDEQLTGVIGKHTAIQKKHEKRYFASKGLNRPQKHYNVELTQVIAQHGLDPKTAHHYENDYMEITTINKK